MSLSEEKEILLSQLVDGELPSDQANQVLADSLGELADVLDNSESCRHLKAMLDLRRAIGPWRLQEHPRAVVAVAPAQAVRTASRAGWRVMSLATAAMLGGILVAGGFCLGTRMGGQQPGTSIGQQSVVVVTPEQRREIARAFALHESVVGPLSWYAADDATIQVAPAQGEEKLDQPIAVVLRLTPALLSKGKGSKTYVIVCRNNDAATIELPQSALAKSIRLRLLSTEAQGEVNLQYVLATHASDLAPDDAALAGRRHLGLGQTALGQLAMNDSLVNVDASAWVLRDK